MGFRRDVGSKNRQAKDKVGDWSQMEMQEEIGRRIGLRIKLESDGNAGKRPQDRTKSFARVVTCWNPKICDSVEIFVYVGCVTIPFLFLISRSYLAYLIC